MRPKQWTKNLVLLAGIIFDRQLNNPISVLRVLIALIIFSLLSGIIYIINDLIDIDFDRQHSTKQLRPIASGKLTKRKGFIAVILLGLVIFTSAFLLSFAFGLVCIGYFLLMLAYSKWLKHIVLIDVMVIAAGFVLRMVAGIVVIKVTYFSPWLFMVTTLLALFLGFGKRRAEMTLRTDKIPKTRKVLDGYTIPFLDMLIIIVLCATLLTYSLYTFSTSTTPQNYYMMFTIPIVLYGLFRYLYLIKVKNFGGAPEEILISDHPTQIAIALWVITVLTIIYIL
ncbi:MAG: decaprenyl-phosphate phosphoribosyltransferase [Anaerolineaceae bacterium]|nr:decaprenyl-phosphate phosphoribosyltransferase [Anaerolineaceae bacterium]